MSSSTVDEGKQMAPEADVPDGAFVISSTPNWGSLSGDLHVASAKGSAEAEPNGAAASDKAGQREGGGEGDGGVATEEKPPSKSKRRRQNKAPQSTADASTNGVHARAVKGTDTAAASAAGIVAAEGAEEILGADDEEPELFIPRSSSLLDAFPAGPPASTQEQLQQLFAHLYMRSVTNFASMRLYALRDGVMGVDRIRALVEGGTSPEGIAEKIAPQEELRRIFETAVVKQVKDQALGYAVEVFASLLRATQRTEEADLQSRLLDMWSTFVAQPDPEIAALSRDPIDYNDLRGFILDQILYGSLQGDVAWEDGTKKKHRWDIGLDKSIQELSKTFLGAAESIDWTAAASAEAHLLRALPPSFLPSILIPLYLNTSQDDNLPSKPPIGPASATSHDRFPRFVTYEHAPHAPLTAPLVKRDLTLHPASSALSEEQAAALGQRLRESITQECKLVADELFKRGNVVEAELLYTRIVEAFVGVPAAAEEEKNRVISPDVALSIDPAVLVNRGAALLKLQRFKEAEESCTLALYIIEASFNLPHSRRRGTKSPAQKGSSSTPRLASRLASIYAQGVQHSASDSQLLVPSLEQLGLGAGADTATQFAISAPASGRTTPQPPVHAGAIAKSNGNGTAGTGAATPQSTSDASMAADLRSLQWKALIRRGRARRAMLEQLFDDDSKILHAAAAAQTTPKLQQSEAGAVESTEEQMKRERMAKTGNKNAAIQMQANREKLFRMAREDFNQALAIDGNETARFEVDSLLAIETKITI